MSRRLESLLPLIGGVFLVFVLGAGAGFAVRHFSIWPVSEFNVFLDQYRAYRATGFWGRAGTFLPAPPRGPDETHILMDPDRLQPGFRAIMGYDVEAGAATVRLFDSQLAEVHRWVVAHDVITQGGSRSETLNPHGLEVLEDGSIVVNFDDGAQSLVRIGPCGDLIWRIEGAYHHSIDRTATGTLLTWLGEGHNDSQLQSIVEVDPETGAVLSEVSLTEDVIAGDDMARAAFRIPEGFTFRPWAEVGGRPGHDIFHPNDVEPLLPEMAAAFPGFNAGDLLISLRNADAVAVLDGGTGRLKWWMNGPWWRQHDPDFQPDGTILLYDNGDKRQSNILRVDPVTRAVTRWPLEGAARFFSGGQGKLQALPNGNLLITVPEEGRVIEVGPDGTLVHAFHNRANETANGRVFNAIWLDEGFFAGGPPDCGGGDER